MSEHTVSFVVKARLSPKMKRFEAVLLAKARWTHRQWYCDMCDQLFSGPGVAARAIIMVK